MEDDEKDVELFLKFSRVKLRKKMKIFKTKLRFKREKFNLLIRDICFWNQIFHIFFI